MAIRAGQDLLHYRLVEKLGEGGMGVVWKAADTTLDREVAIKILPDAFAGNPEHLARFEREAKVLALLNHPNVAAVYGLHEAQGVHFLAMELVPGEDLSQRLARGAIPPAEALPAARRIAQGLEAAHAAGVLHRDLKPANIKVTADGTVKVLDLGLAKPFVQEPALNSSVSPTVTSGGTRQGAFLGTVAYASPEQARGTQVDRRTDVWAFGCVLYEMLTGQRPFSGDTPADTLAAVLEREPDWSLLPVTTPVRIRDLIRRCLQKNPAQRLHDIADARIEIEDALDGPPGVPAPVPVPSRRSAYAWAAAGIILGGILGAWVVSTRLEPAQPVAGGVQRYVIPIPENVSFTFDPDAPDLAVSPDGTEVAFVASFGVQEVRQRGGTVLYLRPLDGFESTAIPGTEGASAPFFSPDGEWIGFVDYTDARLKKVPRRGGAPVVICNASTDFRGATWSPDGTIYFSRDAASGIASVSAGGGTPEPLTAPDRERGEKTHRYPRILPGGHALLFTLGTAEIASYDDAQVAILDLETREHRVLVEGGSNPRYVSSGHIVYGRDGALFAVPFDLDRLEVTGSPFQVLDGVVTTESHGTAQFDVSDGGTLVYAPGGPEYYHSRLFRVDRTGRKTPLDLPSGQYADMKLSHDGRRLAVTVHGANSGVWVYDLERTSFTRLTSRWDNTQPVWHADGKSLAISSNVGGNMGIYRVAADGSTNPEVVVNTQLAATPGSWSPDGRWFTFATTNPETASDIWIVGANGDARAILDSQFNENNPIFSPNGRWLAYVSDESGRYEVYVREFPITHRRWLISTDGGREPLWTQDGREMIYRQDRAVMSVSISGEGELRAGSPERLLELPEKSFVTDVTPDGKAFFASMPLRQDEDFQRKGGYSLRVVLGWLDELR